MDTKDCEKANVKPEIDPVYNIVPGTNNPFLLEVAAETSSSHKPTTSNVDQPFDQRNSFTSVDDNRGFYVKIRSLSKRIHRFAKEFEDVCTQYDQTQRLTSDILRLESQVRDKEERLAKLKEKKALTKQNNPNNN